MDISREQDDDGNRWYERGDSRFMSVTTVLNFLDEDDTGLKRWQAKNDGVGDNAHHEHLFWYSGVRGTICHYQALVTFEEQHEEDTLWGDGESAAMRKLMQGPDEDTFDDASHDLRDITYSVLKNQGVVEDEEEFAILFDSLQLIDVATKDTEYFAAAFNDVCDILGITDSSVITIERYLLYEDGRFGGQCDLVYEDPQGDVVVADLKTSSSLRQKHRLQSVAYSKAVEAADDIPVESVDRVEVIRIDPDDQVWRVHSHEVPPHVEDEERYTDEHWFTDPWGEFDYDSLDEMWEKFTDLVETAHDDVDT